MASPEIIPTADGSHSLFHAQLNETYHSRHGAIRESKHVYIDNGLAHLNPEPERHVLEVGFGTGLNALLAWKWGQQTNTLVRYITLEPYPIPVELWSQLNYPQLLDMRKEHALLHQASFSEVHAFNNSFTLQKLPQSIQEVGFQNDQFDIVFFDAFAPDKQPEMWTQNVFERLYSMLKKGGILVTYCAKGQVKRDLRAVGFDVMALPGPPGKREMIRATR